MDLITALAHLEATKGPGKEKHAEDGELLLTTAEAALRLGMSRPYVSMLCDQGKLGEVRRSEGGHRRIRESAVEAYRLAQREDET
jgi:excisionase family DNA binding protein